MTGMAGYCATCYAVADRCYVYDSRRVYSVLQTPMRDLLFHDLVEGEVGVETARLLPCLGTDCEGKSACPLAVVYCNLLS